MRSCFLTLRVCFLCAVLLVTLAGCTETTPSSSPGPGPGPILSPTTEKPILIRYADPASPNSPKVIEFIGFLKELEKRSQGKLQIKTTLGGDVVLSRGEMLDGIKNKIIDAGQIATSYFVTKLPLTQVQCIPFGAQEHRPAIFAWWELYNTTPELRKEYDDTKLKLIVPWPQDSVQFAFRNKRVTTVDEFKNLRIRTYGAFVPAISELKAVPIAMEFGEIYSSLQQGTIDGAQLYYSLVKGYSMQEVAKYWTECNLIANGGECAIFMNLDVWNGLPADIKKMIEDTAKEYLVKFADAMDKQIIEGQELIRRSGGEIIKLSSKDRQSWEAIAKDRCWDSWRSDMTKAGLPWKLVEEKYFTLLKKYQ